MSDKTNLEKIVEALKQKIQKVNYRHVKIMCCASCDHSYHGCDFLCCRSLKAEIDYLGVCDKWEKKNESKIID